MSVLKDLFGTGKRTVSIIKRDVEINSYLHDWRNFFVCGRFYPKKQNLNCFKMKKSLFVCIAATAALFLIVSGPATVSAQPVRSDRWAATDALGRKVSDGSQCPAKRTNRTVAMFYWTWHTDPITDYERVGNITEILREHPEAIDDFNHPAWNTGSNSYFWDEPLFGYYRTTDPWVLRKHAEMLADAGVDVVFFDCTNASFTWKSSYEALIEVWTQARRDGVDVPRIAFMLPFGPVDNSLESLRQLYEDLYKPGLGKDIWFYWQGKPCIMAYPDNLTDSPADRAIADFFMFRPGQPDLIDGPLRPDHWGWLENYPQHRYGERPDGSCEEMTVGVAQNASDASGGRCCAFNAPGTYGRSYTKHNGHDMRKDAYLYGLNVQEQWDRALENDPDLVFVTGWNEFIAGKHVGWHPLRPYYPFAFPDQFDWEHSRDIEPVKAWGDKGDVYYYQFVDNVRRYKGVSQAPAVSAPQSFRIGRFNGWETVSPDFRHYRGNTLHRSHRGHADRYYTNTTGRNDIVDAKVARDSKYLYFYVETAGILSSADDPNWMLLFLDIDRDKSTGWEGYDFVLNYEKPGYRKAVLSRNGDGAWKWTPAGEVDYAVEGNRMEIRIPRALLNLSGSLDFEFKWSDNMQDEGNIMDFYSNGDVAPGGRFNFVYTE